MTRQDTQPAYGDHWQFKREIQVGHLITTLTVAFGMVWYAGQLEQRVALVEQAIRLQAEKDTSQDVVATEARLRMRQQLDQISAKLDRLIEHRLEQR